MRAFTICAIALGFISVAVGAITTPVDTAACDPLPADIAGAGDVIKPDVVATVTIDASGSDGVVLAECAREAGLSRLPVLSHETLADVMWRRLQWKLKRHGWSDGLKRELVEFFKVFKY